MASSQLMSQFPWATTPLIINAPMAGIATPRLAAEVTRAGGFGFLGCCIDLSANSTDLAALDNELAEARDLLGDDLPADASLRIGAGFLTGHGSVTNFTDTALPILAKHRPAAVWLFAPDDKIKPHKNIIAAVQSLEPRPLVFVQVGNIAAAREAVLDGADVVVAQGVDAGGHQFRQGTGIVSLVPEVLNMLQKEFKDRNVKVVAAGGIADGRGVAAALALGAQGIVMGTKFAVTPESKYADFRKHLILDAFDGGISTFKSPFNDELTKSTLWGTLYDGRAIVGPIHKKFLAGASLQECQQSLAEDYSEEEAPRVRSTWAGAGVGLINKAQPAGEVVAEVQKEAREAIQRIAGLL